MTGECMAANNFAGAGLFEPLRRAFVSLHFGHSDVLGNNRRYYFIDDTTRFEYGKTEVLSHVVSCKKSLEERSILPQDEPKGSEVVEAGD